MEEYGKVHVAVAANHRYVRGLKATLVSMVRASKAPERLVFHVFSDGLTDEDQLELKRLVRDEGLLTELIFRAPDMSQITARFKTYYGTHTAFLRLFLPDLLPDLDWVLWSDVDTLWFRDPAELWRERDETVSVLWSRDIPSTRANLKGWHRKWDADFDVRRYGCSGVLLMNLRKMRETDFIGRCVAFVDCVHDTPFADQAVLNQLCNRDSKFVDDRWDLLNPCRNWRDGVVLHFNGLGKLFNDAGFSGWRPLYEIWFRYYAEVVSRCGGRPDGGRPPKGCPLWKRMAFWLIGFAYLPRTCFAWLPLSVARIDNLHRTQYFCWLRKKKLW